MEMFLLTGIKLLIWEVILALWIELKEISANSRIYFKIMRRLGSKGHLLLLYPCRASKNKYN